ncbi:MAG: hypothetical protein GY835_04145 [bacterium]|nr:hypothetical protein [bacterium]
MMEWWVELTLELQIFYGIGILATTILIIQLILSLFGLGDDLDADGDLDVDGDVSLDDADGLHVLSVKTIIAFMAGFGWTGALTLNAGLALLLAIPIAVAVGAILMWLVFLLMKALYGLRHSGSLNYRNAIGEIGSVYIRIPGNGGGEGQVEVMIQGRLRVIQACTENPDEIPSGHKVRVKGLVTERVLLVETLSN